MTVTELAHFHSRLGDLTPTLRGLAGWAVEAQDKWCADNLSNSTRYMANGTEARGVGFFQQIGNPEVLLLTAHWESVAQHMEWIGSSVNQDAMPRLEEHIDMSKLLFFHVDDLAAFSPEILQASVVAVSRYFVPRYQKQSVDKAIRGMLSRDDAHSVGKSGWRIEKDQAMERDEVEEHVIVSGADSVEHLKDIEAKSFKAVFSGCGEDIRYYKRVL